MKKYLVAICKEGSSGSCPEGREELRDDAMPTMTFKSEADLDLCTDYTLHITPLFIGKRLKERKVAFRTLSQPVEDAARLLTLVKSEAEEKMRKVSSQQDKMVTGTLYL